MNAEDISQKINYIQQANGFTLNVEERAALQSSLLLLKRNGKFNRLVFWGKILGLQKDYLIVQGYHYFSYIYSLPAHTYIELFNCLLVFTSCLNVTLL